MTASLAPSQCEDMAIGSWPATAACSIDLLDENSSQSVSRMESSERLKCNCPSAPLPFQRWLLESSFHIAIIITL